MWSVPAIRHKAIVILLYSMVQCENMISLEFQGGFMFKFILVTGVLLAALTTSSVFADCRGCCSRHGGVVCIDGATQCKDGTPLSEKCAAKGCSKCGEKKMEKKDAN